jgi:hypothetical protein
MDYQLGPNDSMTRSQIARTIISCHTSLRDENSGPKLNSGLEECGTHCCWRTTLAEVDESTAWAEDIDIQVPKARI